MKYIFALLGLIGGFVLAFKFFEMVDWYWWQEGLVGVFLGLFITNQSSAYIAWKERDQK